MNRHLMLSLMLFVALPPLARGQSSALVPDVGIDQRLNETVPLDLTFRDENGSSVALQQYFDQRPVILVLAYYRCPRLCSLVLNHLVEAVQKIDYELGKDFTIVTVSIDPRETPALAAAKKATYIEHYGRPGAIADWHFLTGEERVSKRLAEAVGFRYAYDPVHDEYAHASGIMILTAEGKIARYFYGLRYPPRDLRFGLEDASNGKIGSPITQPLRMLCFSYDPANGTYSLMTIQLVRLGGLATVLVILSFLIRTGRKERQRFAQAPPQTQESLAQEPPT